MELTFTTNANYSPKRVRKATLNGREYYVAPITLIVPGVLDGSKGPLYYPPEEIARNVQQWNGKPLTLNHPYLNGQPVSASRPEALNLFAIGMVLNSRVSKRGNLVADGWFDIELTKRLDTSGKVIASLEAGQPIEQSTGLFNDRIQVQNQHYNGKAYAHIAKNYVADHVAILPHQKGACSVNDGCGVLIENAQQPTELVDNGWSEAARVAAILARKKGIKGAAKLAGRFVRKKINAKIGEVKDKAKAEVNRVKGVLQAKARTALGVKPPGAQPPLLPKKAPPPIPQKKEDSTYGVAAAPKAGKRSLPPQSEVQRVAKVQGKKRKAKQQAQATELTPVQHLRRGLGHQKRLSKHYGKKVKRLSGELTENFGNAMATGNL